MYLYRRIIFLAEEGHLKNQYLVRHDQGEKLPALFQQRSYQHFCSMSFYQLILRELLLTAIISLDLKYQNQIYVHLLTELTVIQAPIQDNPLFQLLRINLDDENQDFSQQSFELHPILMNEPQG